MVSGDPSDDSPGDERYEAGSAGASFSLDPLAAAGGAMLRLVETWREIREQYLSSLSPEDRASVEAREVIVKQAETEYEAREYDLYKQACREAERETERREAQSKADRAAGVIGTMTEIGRPYGLSARAVGKILDEHGLRERVETLDARFESPSTVVMEKYKIDAAARLEEFESRFPNPIPLRLPERTRTPTPGEPMRVLRGTLEGYATMDEHWIAAKVAPLVAPHAKRR